MFIGITIISFIIFLLCVLGVVVAIRMDTKGRNSDWDLVGMWALGIGFLNACFYAIILLVSFFDTTAGQINDFNRLDQNDADRAVAVQQEKDIEAVVVAELRKYPEIEQAVISNLTPEIVLSYPQLQSNTTIIEAAKQLRDAQNKVYDYQYERNETLKSILDTETGINLRNPWMQTYEERFGQPNPLLTD